MFSIVTPFPFLLDFSFYAPLLLRLTLGIYVLSIGFAARKEGVLEGKPDLTPLQIIFRGLYILAGISLIIGLYTQISALIIIILAALALFDSRLLPTTEHSRGELSLLLIIAFSLILTGAGPFAFDLPL